MGWALTRPCGWDRAIPQLAKGRQRYQSGVSTFAWARSLLDHRRKCPPHSAMGTTTSLCRRSHGTSRTGRFGPSTSLPPRSEGWSARRARQVRPIPQVPPALQALQA